MKILVTQEDIDKGEVYCTCCPISLAIKKELGPKYDVGTYSDGIVTIWDGGKYLRTVQLSQKAKNFIAAFDGKGKDAVKPFRFTLKYEKNLNLNDKL